MQYTNFIWRNGQPYSEMFDDIYYSSDQNERISGESEFNHVFFKSNGLPERWSDANDFVVAELGFGSGLNCILTIREWLRHLVDSKQKNCLHYIAIEKYPLSPCAIVELISKYSELKKYCDELIDNYPPAIEGTHSRCLFDNRVVIHYKFLDACDALENESLKVDAWYLDGFSPAKNPDMWSEQLFMKVAQNSHDDTSCSTYTSAGFVKRHLQKAGFIVTKVAGYGKKREMLVAKFSTKNKASLNYSDKPWFESPIRAGATFKKATVIGAGVAGLCVAYALVKRGWSVTIIDRHSDIAKETSENPAAIVYPRLSVNNDVDTEFYLSAYCYNLYMLEKLQKQNKQQFWFNSGLLHLIDKKRFTEIITKTQLNDDYVSVANNVLNDSVLLNPAIKTDQQLFIEYKEAGFTLPATLCNVLKHECGSRLSFVHAEINGIDHLENRWQCLSGSKIINKSEVLVIANGVGVNDLGLPVNYPIESIRGQVVKLTENSESKYILKTVNADNYITPSINSMHYLGATYSRENKSAEENDNDNVELLQSLNETFPNLFSRDDYCGAWVGFRAMSKDRVPIVGALPDKHFFNKEYADICHGKTKKTYHAAKYLKGLYISAAHGSRGFTSSFLSAEIIAAQIEGEPMPVSKGVLDYLNPSRFIVNDLKRR